MMNDLSLLASLLAGMVLGVVFFGGLWWTVQRAMSSHWVGLWFFGSLLLRTVIVLVGLYLSCGDVWQRWLAALLGFTVARLVITRISRPAVVNLEGDHAP
ncbi:ATP synthase subunit I [Pseudomonas moorei]|uniref:ATP synthase subunit I n=1 Tax=Pseudomonas moorei TaxID=395599 RepID=UPI001FF41927|nr:ATP synthase subunit I [Pseudomonas moorei]